MFPKQFLLVGLECMHVLTKLVSLVFLYVCFLGSLKCSIPLFVSDLVWSLQMHSNLTTTYYWHEVDHFLNFYLSSAVIRFYVIWLFQTEICATISTFLITSSTSSLHIHRTGQQWRTKFRNCDHSLFLKKSEKCHP